MTSSNNRKHDVVCNICLEPEKIKWRCCMSMCKPCLETYGNFYRTNICLKCGDNLPVQISDSDRENIAWVLRFAKCMTHILSNHYNETGRAMSHLFTKNVLLAKYADDVIRSDIFDMFRSMSDTPDLDIAKIYDIETTLDYQPGLKRRRTERSASIDWTDDSTIAILFKREMDQSLNYLYGIQ